MQGGQSEGLLRSPRQMVGLELREMNWSGKNHDYYLMTFANLLCSSL